ncbi:MAG: hypothetical protein GKS06_10850 [Acidobacteria bacterium]|nr:hypothetical protein [Acidobacteriota bacterium]
MRILRLALASALIASLYVAAPAAAQTQELIVYLIDHQFVSDTEMATIQDEIGAIFHAQAGVDIRWVLDDSPRRQLGNNELRFLILASDGTRWFHGPSNVIGLAPHDDSGVGRNCFVFYRQALWFRQQAVLRCREATRARTQALSAGVAVDPSIDDLAPAECGEYLPSLTPMVVARAAAHEMVHILLNKLDHSEGSLMRKSFDIKEWLEGDQVSFRLLPEEITALQDLLTPVATTPAR